MHMKKPHLRWEGETYQREAFISAQSERKDPPER